VRMGGACACNGSDPLYCACVRVMKKMGGPHAGPVPDPHALLEGRRCEQPHRGAAIAAAFARAAAARARPRAAVARRLCRCHCALLPLFPLHTLPWRSKALHACPKTDIDIFILTRYFWVMTKCEAKGSPALPLQYHFLGPGFATGLT
jgi:hypothetical protein